MTIDLPEKLESALKSQAHANGLSATGYVREVLERELAGWLAVEAPGPPFKTGRGMLAKYGTAPSAEEIDASRADMSRHFGEAKDF